MTTTNWTPVRELVRVQRELNRAINRRMATHNTGEEHDSAVWSPRVDVSENNEQYTIELDLPGIDKKDVKINYTDDVLSIAGERRVQKYDGVKQQHVERAYGRFYRKFAFPGKINAAGINAKYENGVLTVNVPKADEMKPKSIEIN